VQTTLGIAVAGALGALARYQLDGFVSRRASGPFPWGTLVINLSGAFLLGAAFMVLTERLATPTWVRPTLTVGFLGAYTTFSTLSLETVRLIQDGSYAYAFINSAGSMLLGIAFVYAGMIVGRLV